MDTKTKWEGKAGEHQFVARREGASDMACYALSYSDACVKLNDALGDEDFSVLTKWEASLSVGDKVFWNDPDEGFSSGYYTVDSICSESGKVDYLDTILLLKNEEGSVAEVTVTELAEYETGFTQVEYDRGFFNDQDADYSGCGSYAYIPNCLIDSISEGNTEDSVFAAFTAYTGISHVHIIHYESEAVFNQREWEVINPVFPNNHKFEMR